MNKTKLILPLLVAPVLFGCNNSIAGNYVVDENIAYEFKTGTKEDYEQEKDYPTIFRSISDIQKKIYDDLTTYYGGIQTPDKAVHLTNDYALQRKTKSGESIETKAVNVKEDDESGGTIKFEWGKEKSGYHFYENHTEYVDYLRVDEATEIRSGVTKNLWVGDAGFTVSGNTLTAKFVAKITEGLEDETLKYQIDFTVTAKK